MTHIQIDPLCKLRWIEKLSEKTQQSAKEYNHSMNVDIFARLKESFEDLDSVPTKELIGELTKLFELLNCSFKIK